MKRLTTTLLTITLVLSGLGVAVLGPQPVAAQTDNKEALCEGAGGNWTDGSCDFPGDDRSVSGTIGQITNVIIFLAGAIAVVMIIVGGIRYVMSQGDQSALTSAKNTILYSVIGLVLAIAAYAIVNFVLTVFDAGDVGG